MNLSPIVLFCYNRPNHVLQTLEALAKNDLAEQSILYIYCDGAKQNASEEQLKQIYETRATVKSKQWCKEIHIIEREQNKGLADSVVEGVTEIVNKYGKIIVLEDDIVTSKGFLKYMNDALDLYEKDEKVMHVSGYMYPHEADLPDTFFFNVPLCWGWATWKRAWTKFDNDSLKMWQTITNQNKWTEFNKFGYDYLQNQLSGNITGSINTWFIKWHASTFLNEGFTLFPKTSLVQNIGFDSSGTHKDNNAKHYHIKKLKPLIKVEELTKIEENTIAEQVIKKFYNRVHYKNNKSFLHFLTLNGFKQLIKKIINKVLGNNFINRNKTYVNSSYLGKHVKIYPNTEIHNTLIGNYTYIAHNSFISNTYIGKFCSIGPNLMCGRGIHPINGISTAPMFYSTFKQNGITLCNNNKVKEHIPVKIGNDVFIGANVTIIDGVEIGDGAVIGAGAIVSKNIPPYSIAVGNPIQIIKYRFNEDIIAKLLQIEWWNFSDEKLSEVEKHFNDLNTFISENDQHSS